MVGGRKTLSHSIPAAPGPSISPYNTRINLWAEQEGDATVDDDLEASGEGGEADTLSRRSTGRRGSTLSRRAVANATAVLDREEHKRKSERYVAAMKRAQKLAEQQMTNTPAKPASSIRGQQFAPLPTFGKAPRGKAAANGEEED